MEHLPPWLRNVPLPARPPGYPEPSSQEEEEVDVPEWLRDLQSEVDDQGQSRFDEPEPSVQARSTGVTDWLRGLDEPASAPVEPRSPEPTVPPEQPTTSSRVKMPSGATDWLRSIGQDPDSPSEPLGEAPVEELDQSGVPDWLRDLTAEEIAQAIETETPLEGEDSQHDLPDWLIDSAPAPDASTVPAYPSSAEDPANAATTEPDWLREIMTADAASRRGDAQPSSGLAGDADVPTWLRELVPDAESPPSSAEKSGTDDLPAWLREEGPPAAGGPGAPAADVPAWLREEGPPAAGGPGAPAADVPAWLREEGPPAAGGPGAPAADVPAWLREEGPPATAGPGAPDADVPPWMREEGPPATAGPGAPDADVPPWMREEGPAATDVPDWMREEGPAAGPGAPDADVPPWMREEGPAATDVPAWLRGETTETDLPAWLRDAPATQPSPAELRESEQRGQTSTSRRIEEGDSSSFLKGATLPEWLRIPEPEAPSETAAGQRLDWLRRLGSIEGEESETSISVVTTTIPARPRPVAQRTPEQLEAIRLLQQLAEAPYPTPAVQPAPAKRPTLERIGLERALYAVLLLALLIGLLASPITAPFQQAAPVGGDAAALGALLDGLSADDVVLMAYEWAAQRSSELRPLEEAVTRRLIANRTKLILVSTDLQGTLLSFDLIEPLRAAGYNNENGVSFGGRDYVLLGYRPGGELALRSLVRDLRGTLTSDFYGQDASQGLVANHPDGTPRISGIKDLALILVLADQPQDVQVWMEQVHREVRDVVPIAFLLPQDAQPLALPYLRLPNVYAVAGQQGALALLASDPTADPASVARSTGQLAFSVTAFVVLLLIGGGIVLVTRRRRAEES